MPSPTRAEITLTRLSKFLGALLILAMRISKKQLGLGVLGFVTVFTIWYFLNRYEILSPLFLPAPRRVLYTMGDLLLNGELLEHTRVSLIRVAIGFGISFVVGIGLGILMGQFRTADAIGRPLVDLIRPIPGLAWIPLALLWFGIGEESKIFIIFLAAVFPITISTYDGVRYVDPILRRAGTSLGASPRQLFFKVNLPAALPSIFTGVRVGLMIAIRTLVAAELVASTAGLGWLIMESRRFFRPDLILVGMVAIGVIGLVLNSVLAIVEKRMLRWHAAVRIA